MNEVRNRCLPEDKAFVDVVLLNDTPPPVRGDRLPLRLGCLTRFELRPQAYSIKITGPAGANALQWAAPCSGTEALVRVARDGAYLSQGFWYHWEGSGAPYVGLLPGGLHRSDARGIVMLLLGDVPPLEPLHVDALEALVKAELYDAVENYLSYHFEGWPWSLNWGLIGGE